MREKEGEYFEKKAHNNNKHKMQCADVKEQIKQKPQAHPKQYFIQWVKNMPFQERYLALKVHAPNLAHTIRDALKKLDSSLRSDPIRPMDLLSLEQSSGKKLSKTKIALQKGFMEGLVFVSDGHNFFDSLCFDFNLLENPERLYDLLTAGDREDKIANPFDQTVKMKRQLPQILEDISKSKSVSQLTSVLIRTLRHQIFINCQNHALNSSSIAISLDEQKRRKKQFSFYWKNLPQQLRKKLLMLYKSDLCQLEGYLEELNINIKGAQLQKQIIELMKLQKNDFCNRIFKCKLKKSLHDAVSYYQLIYKAWKLQVEKFRKRRYNRGVGNANNVAGSKVENLQQQKHSNAKGLAHNSSSIQLNSQKREKAQTKIPQIQNGQKNQKFNREAKERTAKICERRRHKSISAQSNETNETQYQKIQKCHYEDTICNEKWVQYQRIETKRGKQKQKAQTKKQSRLHEEQIEFEMQVNPKRKIESLYYLEKEHLEKYLQGATKVKSEKHQKLKSQKMDKIYNQKLRKPQIGSSSSSTIFYEKAEQATQVGDLQARPDVNLTPQKALQTTPVELTLNSYEFQQIVCLKIAQDMQQLSDIISQQANQFHERRVVSFQRLQFLLQFYQVPIKLFGSCASGIAIKNSDIDVAIDNCIINYFDYLPESQRIKAALERLEQIFKGQSWVKNLKLIKTAAIPLIKLTADTSTQFLDYATYGHIYQVLNRPHNKGTLQVDITIQSKDKSSQCSHLGIISTQAINKWLKQIQSLHTIVIILKQLFYARKLNLTYAGGMNTYSMIVMVVAFIYENKLQEEEAGIVFRKLANFYKDFDEKTYGIDLESKGKAGGIYYKKIYKQAKQKQHQQADLEIKDPLNNGKIMTRNCYSFSEIKALFSQIRQHYFQKIQQQLLLSIEKAYKSYRIVPKEKAIQRPTTEQLSEQAEPKSKKNSKNRKSQSKKKKTSIVWSKCKEKPFQMPKNQKHIELVGSSNMLFDLLKLERSGSLPFSQLAAEN